MSAVCRLYVGYAADCCCRDVFGIGGRVERDVDGNVTRIVLNQANRLARWLLAALQTLASSADVAVRMGEIWVARSLGR